MTFTPLHNIVHIKIEKPKAGVLDTSSRAAAIELGEVLAVGEGVKGIKPGDHVFVKSWAIDIITHEEEQYYFVNVETNGILAVVNS